MSTGVSKRVVLIIISVAAFATSFLVTAVNVALPTIGRELAMEAVLLGWVANSPMLAAAVLLVPFGRLADIFGRKRIFLYGTYLSVISTFLCAIANSGALIISFRLLQGISNAMMIGTAVAILILVFPFEERGKALGVNASAVYLGQSVGPFLGGIMTQNLGWRSIFFLGAGLGIVVVVLALWKLKGEWIESGGEKFDIIGSIAFCLSLVMVLYGFTVLPDTLGIILVVLGALVMLWFIRWEAKLENPILNVGILRKNTIFIFSNLATLINYLATFAVVFLLSLYLQYTKGLSPRVAGSVLLVQPLVMAIFSPFAGRLADRSDPKIVAAVGVACNCVALLLFIFLTGETSLGYVIGGLAIFGSGMGLFVSPNTTAVMGSVEKKDFGVASGVQATTRAVGMTLSMGVVMILFSIFIGEAQITPEYYPAFLTSMRVAFIVFAVLCFGGIFSQLAGRTEKQPYRTG